MIAPFWQVYNAIYFRNMSTQEILKSVSLLILSIGLMMTGYGMFSTFISLRMEIEGFSRQVIGYQTSAFYFGLIIGSIACSKLINQVGHIRAFAVFCGASASAILMFPFFKFIGVWILLRGVLGFCLAGMYMVVESWLNSRTSKSNRGAVLSIYMMTNNFAFAAGQLILNFGDPNSTEFFMLGAALYALALIPVSVTRSSHPEPVESDSFKLSKLFKISPVAMSGCVANGLVIGAVIGLSPVFVNDLGYGISTITIFMTLFMISGLIFQFPIGKLSDVYDRRIVILVVTIMMGLATIPLILIKSPGEYLLYVTAILLGATTQTLYPLCISYANDYLNPEELVKASGGLVLAYGLGAAVGPTLSAYLMENIAANGLFYYIAAVVAIFTFMILYRIPRRETPEEKETFVAMPDAVASPGGLEFDPRYDPESEQHHEQNLESQIKPNPAATNL